MRIDKYYRYVARLNLNAGILALFPAMTIIAMNLSIYHNQQIMLLTIPFFLYSFISFQSYLFKLKQAIIIEKNLMDTNRQYHSLFEAGHLVTIFMNTISPRLLLFFPDGYLAAVVKRQRKRGKGIFADSKIYYLYSDEELMCSYLVKGKKQMLIEVYDPDNVFVGCFERTKLKRSIKNRKELLNAEGRFVGAVEGSPYYMDEQILDPYNRLVIRLRRGWMPLEWSNFFPEPNTPVLSLSNRLSEKEKLLQLSLLINEFFIER